MALKYVAVPEYPLKMPDADLRTSLGRLPDRVLIRSLIVAEVEAIRAGMEIEERTMRGFWYSLIKPVLSHIGRLNQKTSKGNPVNWAKNLSEVLAELVRVHYTTYEELRIIDGSRLRQAAVPMNKNIIDPVNLVGAHFPWAILFTEKDTIYPVVKAVAELYGVSVISGSGEPSLACTENTVREIVRRKKFKKARPDIIILLSLTDYDQDGYIISRAQFVQVQETIEAIEWRELGYQPVVLHERLGLEPDQLTPEERTANSYEPKQGKKFDDWYTETGGVDGQPLGLELDALPLSRIRRMFAEGIERHIDLKKRQDDLRAAFVDLIACETLKPDFDTSRAKLNRAIKDDDLWRDIINTEIPDDLFKRAAIAGWNNIDPLEDTQYIEGVDLFDDYADEVRDLMKEALEELSQ